MFPAIDLSTKFFSCGFLAAKIAPKAHESSLQRVLESWLSVHYYYPRASFLRSTGDLVTIGPGQCPLRSETIAVEGVLIQVGVLPGDGVGPEVMAEALDILGIVGRLEGLEYELVPFDLGGERFLRTGDILPEDEINRLARCDAILLGAVGHPKVAPGILEKGILLRLRFDFQQYINLRPIQLFPGVEGPIRGKGPEDVDMVVVRENNEDLYEGSAGFTRKGTPEEGAIQTSVSPRAGVYGTMRYAFDLARGWASSGFFRGLSAGDRAQGLLRQVTLLAKANVLTFAHDLWMRVFTIVSLD